jgi:hypothetical protein
MTTTKKGQEPAFPKTSNINPQEGMNKRFYAACAAMQGLASREDRNMVTIENDVKLAYEFADELLKQEEL